MKDDSSILYTTERRERGRPTDLRKQESGGQRITWYHTEVLVHRVVYLSRYQFNGRKVCADLVDPLRRGNQIQKQNLRLLHPFLF